MPISESTRAEYLLNSIAAFRLSSDLLANSTKSARCFKVGSWLCHQRSSMRHPLWWGQAGPRKRRVTCIHYRSESGASLQWASAFPTPQSTAAVILYLGGSGCGTAVWPARNDIDMAPVVKLMMPWGWWRSMVIEVPLPDVMGGGDPCPHDPHCVSLGKEQRQPARNPPPSTGVFTHLWGLGFISPLPVWPVDQGLSSLTRSPSNRYRSTAERSHCTQKTNTQHKLVSTHKAKLYSFSRNRKFTKHESVT